jgi:hypothetical protein
MLKAHDQTSRLPRIAIATPVVIGVGIASGLVVAVVGSGLSLMAFAGITALLLLFWVKMDWLVCIWLLTLPFDYRTLTVGPVGISAGDAVLLIWAGRLAFQFLLVRRTRFRFSPQFISLFPFVLAIPLSLLGTSDLQREIRYLLTALTALSIPVLLASTVRSERSLSMALDALVVAGTLNALAAWAQYAAYYLAGIVLWEKPDTLYYIRYRNLPFLRTNGFYPETNFLALFLVPPLAVALGRMLFMAGPLKRRVLWACIFVLNLGAILSTVTRGVILALPFILIAAVLMWKRQVAVGLVVVGVLLLPLLFPLLNDLFTSVVDMQPRSAYARLELLRQGWERFCEVWLTGAGMAERFDLSLEFTRNTIPRELHNSYLQLLVGWGVLGLLGLVLLVVIGTWDYLQSVSLVNNEDATYLKICALGLLAMLVPMASLSAFLFKPFWVTLGLFIAACSIFHE